MYGRSGSFCVKHGGSFVSSTILLPFQNPKSLYFLMGGGVSLFPMNSQTLSSWNHPWTFLLPDWWLPMPPGSGKPWQCLESDCCCRSHLFVPVLLGSAGDTLHWLASWAQIHVWHRLPPLSTRALLPGPPDVPQGCACWLYQLPGLSYRALSRTWGRGQS